MVDFIRKVVDGPVHVIAESAGAAAGCWVAALQPAAALWDAAGVESAAK
jgi:hypothetical protein